MGSSDGRSLNETCYPHTLQTKLVHRKSSVVAPIHPLVKTEQVLLRKFVIKKKVGSGQAINKQLLGNQGSMCDFWASNTLQCCPSPSHPARRGVNEPHVSRENKVDLPRHKLLLGNQLFINA